MRIRSDRDNRACKLVQFGRGGDQVYLARLDKEDTWGGGMISGYGTPERPHAAEGFHPADGTPVLDVRPALETREGYLFAFKTPMVDPELQDGLIDRMPDPDPLFAEAVAGNQYGSMLSLQRLHKASGSKAAGPLDKVSVRQYVAGWAAVGARVGAYRNGEIVWADEAGRGALVDTTA